MQIFDINNVVLKEIINQDDFLYSILFISQYN